MICPAADRSRLTPPQSLTDQSDYVNMRAVPPDPPCSARPDILEQFRGPDSMTEAYLCGAVRTPIGRYADALSAVRASWPPPSPSPK